MDDTVDLKDKSKTVPEPLKALKEKNQQSRLGWATK